MKIKYKFDDFEWMESEVLGFPELSGKYAGANTWSNVGNWEGACITAAARDHLSINPFNIRLDSNSHEISRHLSVEIIFDDVTLPGWDGVVGFSQMRKNEGIIHSTGITYGDHIRITWTGK